MSLALMEAHRSVVEFWTLPWNMPILLDVPVGDGHPVVFCPGFMYSDLSFAPLRRYLRRVGYDVYGWNQGRNLGLGKAGEPIEQVVSWVKGIAEHTGKPVSLVGWSLGGILARETAKVIPDKVRQVITLGTMIRGTPESSNAHQIYKMVAEPDGRSAEIEALIESFPPPPESIPTTSIFSKTDGIVPWRGCIEERGDLTDNVEVHSSHLGLGFHPAVFHALADRLAQTKETWSPFDRKAPTWRSYVYPSCGHSYL